MLAFWFSASSCSSVPARTAAQPQAPIGFLATDSLQSRDGDGLDEELALWRETFSLLRGIASDSTRVATADAIAAEAETAWLMGDPEEASLLWGDAFDLLADTPPDTILLEPPDPPQGGSSR